MTNSLCCRITSQNWDASQKNLSLVICDWLFVILSFACLGGPDRRAEDAGELTIFLDETLDASNRAHPSFQNDQEPDAGLIELFDRDSKFMYEVGTAFRTPRFAVVRGWRSASTLD